uniref:VWFA domain-containing protein n=1 Tax=Kalanchoe fedtschenkoi TaxID=63787 RepID=A0A7N0T2Q6_KALFE
MSADEFASSVELGLRLAKRIRYAKYSSASPAAPPQLQAISRSSSAHYQPAAAAASSMPSAPMLYAVIKDPAIVDNPDICSYQPYVHGRCDPPALIPLEMHALSLHISCFFDTAFLTLQARWRLHCVTASKTCECRIALPINHQASVLGVEVDVAETSYATQMVFSHDKATQHRPHDTLFLKHHIYTVTLPQVHGGSFVNVTANWSQKLLFDKGLFTLHIPFTFPHYVNPVIKTGDQRETIQLNVNCGPNTQLLCNSASHPFKEVMRQVGKLGFIYDCQVKSWSMSDISFTYKVSSSDISSGLFLQSPPVNDVDQRGMFCLYIFPGNRKVFRKSVIFVVDISGSMLGSPLDSVKNAVLAALSGLDKQDNFNIVAFNEETNAFSQEMEPATEEAIQNAHQWINKNFTAEGGTNFFRPLNQALEMLATTSELVPQIVFITDGSVLDERQICNVLSDHFAEARSAFTRISTFGIESIEYRMERIFDAASSIILANIKIETSATTDKLEIYPRHIPDLTSTTPVFISGRYSGKFPEFVKVTGELADGSKFTQDMKPLPANDIPLDKVFARRDIDLLTANAWLTQSKQLEEKVARLSMQTGFPSEYTHMILVQTNNDEKAPDVAKSIKILGNGEVPKVTDFEGQKIILMGDTSIGFGDLASTASNVAPGRDSTKSSEPILVKAASNCCSAFLDRCCCMCFIQALSRVNDQCAVAFTQLCSALACVGCLSCCFDLCDSCSELCG